MRKRVPKELNKLVFRTNESNDDEYIIENCIVSNATKYKVLTSCMLYWFR